MWLCLCALKPQKHGHSWLLNLKYSIDIPALECLMIGIILFLLQLLPDYDNLYGENRG